MQSEKTGYLRNGAEKQLKTKGKSIFSPKKNKLFFHIFKILVTLQVILYGFLPILIDEDRGCFFTTFSTLIELISKKRKKVGGVAEL